MMVIMSCNACDLEFQMTYNHKGPRQPAHLVCTGVHRCQTARWSHMSS